MQANFKASTSQEEHNMEELCKDPAYIEYLNQMAEKDHVLSMLEKNLEPC